MNIYAYSVEKLRETIGNMLEKNVSAEAWRWLSDERENVNAAPYGSRFSTAFVMTPRKTGKHEITLGEADASSLTAARPGLSINGWTADQLSRAWLILHLDASDPDRYAMVIERLFMTAEMNELVALYSSLPLLAYPDQWRKRCAEGIRSNIGKVLDAVMCRNPYPAEQLDQPAWNQLVLKAIFTDKPLLEIHHIRERSNAELALAISDFAHERWAAHRQVNPLVWLCVEDFIDEQIFHDLERLTFSKESGERKAAALVCASTTFTRARELLNRNPELRQMVERDGLTWNSLARELLPGAA